MDENKTMKQEKDLKAFLFTYYVATRKDPLSILIVAFDKKEAGDIFLKWTTDKNIQVLSLVIKAIRRNKRNAYYYTLERYNRQRRLVFDFNSDLNALIAVEHAEELEKEKAGL